MLRLGAWLRFVPYPVIGGFLAASGWLLITGGIEVMTGVAPGLSLSSLTAQVSPDHLPHFLAGILFAAFVFAMRRRIDSFLVLPMTFVAFVLVLDVLLLTMGQVERLGGRDSWFLGHIGTLQMWMPLAAASEHHIHWGAIAMHAVEIGAHVYQHKSA